MNPRILSKIFLASTSLATLPAAGPTAADPHGPAHRPVLAQVQPALPGRAAPSEADPADPRLRRERPRPREGAGGGADEGAGERRPTGERLRGPNAAEPDAPPARRLPGAGPAGSEQPEAPRGRQNLQAPAANEPAPIPPQPGSPAGTPRRLEPAQRAPGAATSPETVPQQTPPGQRPGVGAPTQRPPTGDSPGIPAAPPSGRPPVPSPTGSPAAPGRPPAATPSVAPEAPAVRPGEGTVTPGTAAPTTQDRSGRQRPDRVPPAAPNAPASPVAPPSAAPPAGLAPQQRATQPPAQAVPPSSPQAPPAARSQPSPGARPAAPLSTQPAPQVPGTVPGPIGRPAPVPDRLAPGIAPERLAPGVATGRDVRIDELRALRRERVEEGGRRVIIEEPGERFIVRENGREFIRHNETERFRRAYGDADIRVERRGVDEVTIVRRPNGVEIVTVRDPEGNLIRRVRRDPRGSEVVLIENEIAGRPRTRTVIEEVADLPPPRVTIPREKYVVEVERASQEDLYEAFTAPPVERVERRYTLEEVRRSQNLRERVRRVDVDTVTFEFGSWQLSEDQIGALTGVAQAIASTLSRNPDEIFLIEGHTDAVGSDVDNLTLSDRRAETVATILTERFGIPAENLTTQGYGEQYLKVNTQEAAQENRRVTVRNITPLLRQQAAR